jgi:P-type Ca2+ transporter type 2C
MSESNTTSTQGLSTEEVITSRTKNSVNSTEHQQKTTFYTSFSN